MSPRRLDLREILSFHPSGGVIRFMDQRVLLQDAVTLGLLRRELVESIGAFATRTLMTRLGYANGWRSAEMLRHDYPDLWDAGTNGPRLLELAGHALVTSEVRTDGLGAAPLAETFIQESQEAEQHLLQVGLSDEPVCWHLAAFASGFESLQQGREVYFIEDRCIGKGDSYCRVRARFRDRWGPEFEAHLPYFRTRSLDAALAEVTGRLRRTERRLRARKQELAVYAPQDADPSGIVARSEAMQRTLDLARRAARTESSVIVMGESGVGKEKVARLIHSESPRSGKAFVSLNCAAITESLIERELFGHARGAFTGADRDSVGMFEAANGGTLFLDEIGELSPSVQVKLLRAIQEKEIRRVGETRSRPVDVRIVAATNRNLAQEVSAGRFRQDLYYRLRVIELVIPPLRDRPEDILALARLFLRRIVKDTRRPVSGFAPRAVEQLARYRWPGNVRELENAIERAVALCAGPQVGVDDLPPELRAELPAPATRRAAPIRPLDEVEREHILAAMDATDGNKAAAAEALGIGIATMYRKLKTYGAP